MYFAVQTQQVQNVEVLLRAGANETSYTKKVKGASLE